MEEISPTGDAVAARRSFKLNEFEGPLDLLLFLIRKNEVNIYDIPIARITEQYLDYLRYAETLDLDEVTEFHVMAATLLLIKSRTLLPVEMESGEGDDPRQNLVEKLIEYQKFKKLSELMEEKEKDAEWVIERRRIQRPLPFTDAELWEKVDTVDLWRTFSAMMQHYLPSERIIDLYEEVTENEKVTLIAELLENRGEFFFTDLIIRSCSIMDIVCAFLAVLESVKDRVISVFQHRMFGDILIKRFTAQGV